MPKRLIPEDSFDVQVILNAMDRYAEAKATHDRERDAYQGYSWGYWGSEYVDKMEAASLNVKELLNQYIDARIIQAIKEHLVEGR